MKGSQRVCRKNTGLVGARWILLVAAAFTLSVQAQQAPAQDDETEEKSVQEILHPYLTDRFRFHVGAFFPQKSYRLSADGSITGEHPQIDFDETFGYSSSEEVATAEFHWRFGENWFFETQYFEINDTGSAVLEEDLVWEDVTFPAGSFARSAIDFEIARLFFGRRLKTTANSEFSIGAGIHWIDISAFIEGEILLGANSSRFHREEVGLEGPLPNIGFSYIYSSSPKLAFIANVDWLSLSVDKWSGGFWNVSAGANYQFSRHFGMNLQYMYMELDFAYDDPDWRGEVDIKFKGPYLSIGWSW